MSTVALEFVPPSVEAGPEAAVKEARKARSLLAKSGLGERVNTLLLPHLVAEEEDRPVPLTEKMDPLETRKAIFDELPLSYILAQVTAFSPVEYLEKRVTQLQQEGVKRIVFIGVPRTMEDGEGPGMSPISALSHFRNKVPSRGVILIPTRPEETRRFQSKLEAGANFAVTQLLYSDHIVKFLKTMPKTDHLPEILLSFGYVPKAELKVGLIRWLIQDKPPEVQDEMGYVSKLADLSFQQKKARLVDLYRHVIEGTVGIGFPLGLHLECPYGFSEPAMETFHAMLDFWSPRE
jgi:hypothetical protein